MSQNKGKSYAVISQEGTEALGQKTIPGQGAMLQRAGTGSAGAGTEARRTRDAGERVCERTSDKNHRGEERLGGSVNDSAAFGSGRDLGVPGLSLASWSLLSRESASPSPLALHPPTPPTHARSISLAHSNK